MKRRSLALLALAPVALLAVGCATPADDDSAAAAVPYRPLTTLAAGDSAGQALFAQPVAIGPMNSPNTPVYAEVPTR